jgi:hypothetical protein
MWDFLWPPFWLYIITFTIWTFALFVGFKIFNPSLTDIAAIDSEEVAKSLPVKSCYLLSITVVK